MTTYSLTYEITERRFMQACRALWAHRALGSTGNLIAGGLLSAFAAFVLWQGVPGIVPWALLAGGVAVLALNAARDRMWRGYFRNAPKFQAAITAHLSPSGVGVTSAEGENDVPWSHFRHYVITPDTLFLIIDQRQFSIIPLSACADASERAAVEKLVTSKLKPLRSRMF
ncbi:YcxB family protein [Yoonia sp. R2331]|uniref:YcxB family protein n=1 Tax=Yoonia sp. R2331 TaxID=3237238 RepID=UPI0034E58D07